MKNLKLVPTFLLLTTLPLSSLAADLSINIDGIKSSEGNIVVGILDGAKGFPSKREPLTGQIVKADVPGINVIFKNLKPGKYAVVAFHDVDTSGEINRNFIGFPTEAYGFSNNARGKLSPPDFKDASFEFQEESLEIRFTISK